jgi:hypothetical protein
VQKSILGKNTCNLVHVPGRREEGVLLVKRPLLVLIKLNFLILNIFKGYNAEQEMLSKGHIMHKWINRCKDFSTVLYQRKSDLQDCFLTRLLRSVIRPECNRIPNFLMHLVHTAAALQDSTNVSFLFRFLFFFPSFFFFATTDGQE